MTSEEDLLRFHNGDTLDNIPVIRLQEPRRIPWRTVASVVGIAAFVGAVFGWSFGMGKNAGSGLAAGAPSPTATISDSPSPSPTPTLSVVAEPSCHNVEYKLPTGPQMCVPKSEMCPLGSPYHTTELDEICGVAPVAHIFVDNTDLVYGGSCLRSDGGSWATATASMTSADEGMVACGAYVLYTEWEVGSPLKTCDSSYPNTRITFLAEIKTLRGSVMGCIDQVWGA